MAVGRLAVEDFMRLFDAFERTAWRLETRDYYHVAEEQAALRDFLAGKPIDLAQFEPWWATVRRIVTTGRTMSRVRLVSEPPTDYQRFELAAAPANISAGETIMLLERSRASTIDLPDYDFWLFDDARLVTMVFADDGHMVEAIVTDDQDTVQRHREVQARAAAAATPYADHHASRPACEA
jgi:hypothetical protein